MIIRQAYKQLATTRSHLNALSRSSQLANLPLVNQANNSMSLSQQISNQSLFQQQQYSFSAASAGSEILKKVRKLSKKEQEESLKIQEEPKRQHIFKEIPNIEADIEEMRADGLTNINISRKKEQIRETKIIQEQQKEKEMEEQEHQFDFYKGKSDKAKQDRNYQRMIMDTYDCVKFLNKLPLGVLEESLSVFRSHLFNMSDRKMIAVRIFEILQKEYQIEQQQKLSGDGEILANSQDKKVEDFIGHNGDESLMIVANQVYASMQTILEFMDKGIKGLLSGDMSVYIIQQIQTSIEKYMKTFNDISAEIDLILQKQISVEQFLQENFQVGMNGQNQVNNPNYESLENFESYMLMLDQKDWKKSIQVQDTISYQSPGSLINPDMLKNSKVLSSPNQISQIHFENPENMKIFMQNRVKQVQDTQQERLEALKKEINFLINKLYQEVCKTAFNLDKYRLPVHGVQYPQFENPMNLFQRQLKIEELSFELSQNKYKNQLDSLIKIGRGDQLAVSHRYILSWMRLLETSIAEQQKIFIKRGNLDPKNSKIGYYLIQMPSEKIASLCVLHLMKHLFKQFIHDIRQFDDEDFTEKIEQNHEIKIPAIQLFDELGKLFEKELKNTLMTGKKSQKKPDDEEDILQEDMEQEIGDERNALNKKIAKHMLMEDNFIGHLPRDVQLKIGAFLTNLMCKNLKYKIGNKSYLLLKPQVLKQQEKKYLGYIIFNRSFIETFVGELDKIHDLSLQLERSLPMIYQPAPWKNFTFGGYYLKQTKMAKVIPNFKEAQKYLQRVDLTNMCQVLDILGSVKWRINRRILEIIEYVWSIGGGLGEVPKRFNDRQITPEMIKETNFREKLKLLKEHQKNRETHALRCEFLLRLSIAQSFKHVNQIYFPHNMDFRGRVYPIPPHLNHMGADVNRGLLQFAEGQPLGKDGLFWLKVHVSNKIGKDKLPIVDRAAYAESEMDMIHRCADDPKNNLDWLQSDNPWQTLSAMIELSQAVRCKNPEEYISYQHVHVDGSCNGMQHYAALGRDDRGARQVNLADSERPGDVYTAILRLVIEHIENEQDQALHEVAEGLKGNVNRKTIKQTVMTSVYGVTFIGARKQIQRQLKDRKLYETNGELYKASQYLAKVTIKCIGDLFRDANNIKEWFSKCAKVVASTNEPVRWITPLGLPCVQPYKSVSNQSVIKTILQQITVADSLDDQPVNKQKQNSAFPPNFVHSLDSTHMMYTALECKRKGIVFAAVHDSFWAHPSNITEMNATLRQQFVTLHGSSVLENLYENFTSRYPNEKFPEIPKRGSFDLNEVRKSTYFFS